MYAVQLAPDADDIPFRAAAKRCLAAALRPEQVSFLVDQPSLLPAPPDAEPSGGLRISRELALLVEEVSVHRTADRFDLLYGLIWRYLAGERDVLERASDPAVLRALNLALAVRRDIHKMHAFLRFRESERDGRPFFSAWFAPEHRILKRALPFFTGRFASMDWLIGTPEASAVWRDGRLTYGPGAARPDDTGDAVLETLWNTYFQAIFNPARLHVNAMLREMPKRYWRDMPETQFIPGMLKSASARAGDMTARPADDLPKFAGRVAAQRAARLDAELKESERAPGSLASLAADAEGCARCPLHAHATQTVFGEGPADAPLMFVGEQPGDQEDLAGRPFVGPAGQLFDKSLRDAGIERARAYVTNAVKHFKFEPRGKRRIHKKPNESEVTACRWWLQAEIEQVRPRLIVALGATAALSLTGRPVAILKERGKVFEHNGRRVLVTVHPSFLLRVPDQSAAEREYRLFVADLRLAGATLADLEAA